MDEARSFSPLLIVVMLAFLVPLLLSSIRDDWRFRLSSGVRSSVMEPFFLPKPTNQKIYT